MMFDEEQYDRIVYHVKQLYWYLYYICMIIIYLLYCGAYTINSFVAYLYQGKYVNIYD